ncbi:hypothetical protein HN592_04470 [Candidatus Woesearchaeota archaeon]|jgi:hypothetical protein|nr:hypothetical protein [Candidatus Woesearchaeota archaeon]MBT4368466.1 hypothetical protein [Candidatus Woesearchaeota archaeon]MBT4712955.1 hypothetical protein [Candidatus Woesearchaeota archaeon]MBT6639867.1 hypothetical protein [Candidatus Woesearchaeota archaeon]MBT7134039.1 hypothetical protein [Candidatus Woesearchaeota archaeon]
MTNLSLIQRLRYSLLNEMQYDNCTVRFWANYKRGLVFSLIDGRLLNEIMSVVLKTKRIGFVFNDVDIVFKVEKKVSREKVKEKLHNSSLELGKVVIDDLDKSKDVIYLNIEDVFSLELLQSHSEQPENIRERAKDNFRKTLLACLIHELVHLRHYHMSNSKQIRKKNIARLERISGGEKRELAGLKHLERKKVKDLETLQKYVLQAYINVRKLVEEVKLRICWEGMALFIEKFVIEARSCDEMIQVGEKHISEMKASFEFILTALEFGSLKRVYKKSPVPFRKSDLAELVLCARGSFDTLVSKIIGDKNALIPLTYKVAPAIPATIFKFERMPIKTMAKLNHVTLLREYESVCMKHGITPLIAITSRTNAVFHLGKGIRKMNRLRKDMGMLAEKK